MSVVVKWVVGDFYSFDVFVVVEEDMDDVCFEEDMEVGIGVGLEVWVEVVVCGVLMCIVGRYIVEGGLGFCVFD